MAQTNFFISTILLLIVSASGYSMAESKAECPVKAECERLQPLAEAGDAQAQFDLGSLYYYGPKVEYAGGLQLMPKPPSKTNRIEAEKWWRKSGEQGNQAAIFELAKFVYTVQLSKAPLAEKKERIDWWKHLAEQGNLVAQDFLAFAYSEGNLGVDKDMAEAVNWWKKSAAQGSLEAMRALYSAYCRGSGVKKDKVEADRWYAAADSVIHQNQSWRISRYLEKNGCSLSLIE